jgi:DNA-binding response OmpR family regulator
MIKILVVEDEAPMLQGLKDNLEFEGYEVDTAADGKSGEEKINTGKYDLIILDIMLPYISGFDLCRNARKADIDTPIILLTAKGEEIDKVLGLELGADDYITKPFSLRELLARIKAILRRTADKNAGGDKPQPIQIGRLTISFRNYEAFEGKDPVRLSHKEFEIIHYLYENANKTVDRDDLMSKVWGIEYDITTRTVDNFIVKIRQKIETDPNSPKLIHTVHGIGYKLVL